LAELDHTRCFICIHVFDNTRPVLLAARGSDGDWMLLCGDTHPQMVDQCKLVGIGHITSRDPTLNEILDLPPGFEAERPVVGGAWERRAFDDAEDGTA
jgi:hypothetical protein